MTAGEVIGRVSSRLGISGLNPMQEAMAALPVPVRVQLVAPTGSGKTLAFAIPFIKALPAPEGIPSGLILAPTRELVLQIYETVRTIAAPDYKTSVLYGGHSFAEEEASLAVGCEIIVATPGRLLDHLRRGTISIHGVKALVLDEYDKALELGFQPQMESITGRLKSVSTLILTSATGAGEIPPFIDGVGMRFLDFSDTAGVVAPELHIEHLHSPAADKLDALEELLRSLPPSRTIVFVNHRDAAERIFKALKAKHFPAGIYHGGLEQADRERALILFENGTTPILISTDLASRGLDIKNLDNVVHYHLPVSEEVWTHRNGRSGRQGTQANIIVITSDADKIPPFISWDRELTDNGCGHAIPQALSSTIYFNAGKKEKISRGDIAGFLIQKGGLKASEVGKIEVRDHCAYAGVPAGRARMVIEECAPHRLKGQKVRLTQIKF